MRPDITDKDLIEAWHSDRSVAELCKIFACNGTWLHRQWIRLRDEHGAIPCGYRQVDEQTSALSRKSRNLENSSIDGRPSLLHEDGLLDALWREHPGGPREDPGVRK